MNSSSRPTRVDIDLTALCHNLHQVRSFCSDTQGVLAVVKADAYGHGALEVSLKLQEEGVQQFAVATLEEALALRDGGIELPILVLGGCYPGQEDAFARWALAAVVCSLSEVRRLAQYTTDKQRPFSVHLKCDTGMGRIGFMPAEIPLLIDVLTTTPGVQAEGLMSHLACADQPDVDVTQRQIATFRRILTQFHAAGIYPPSVHLANSAGLSAWDFPEATLVRPGIMLYGGYPSPAFTDRLDLHPVMTFSTRIVHLRTLAVGQGVSYGHSYTTQRDARIATLPVGYADGYNRLFSNCGEVLVRGQRAPVVGRVCMDWILIDVTDIETAEIGDRVVLLGRDGGQTISVEDWATKLNTINYEVFCRISPRVPRCLL